MFVCDRKKKTRHYTKAQYHGDVRRFLLHVTRLFGK